MVQHLYNCVEVVGNHGIKFLVEQVKTPRAFLEIVPGEWNQATLSGKDPFFNREVGHHISTQVRGFNNLPFFILLVEFEVPLIVK